MEKPKPNLLFCINITLLLSGITTAFSGLTIMLHYHMGHHGAISITDTFWGLHYLDWSGIHKTSTIVLSLLMAYHVLLHWKWYKNVVLKNLIANNRQVLLLSFIFIVSFLTGFIPWILQLGVGTDTIRRSILEIHDKLGIVLIVFLVLHIRKRFKWFKNTFVRLKL